MAGIDKTYLRYDEYLVLKQWCENTKLTYDNGVEGSPTDFLYLYNEPYEEEAPVWNTPTCFDRWLYHNCPLSFIQKRLREQYNNPEEEFNEPLPNPELGSHYIILSKPKYNWRYDKTWWLDIRSFASDGAFWNYGLDSHTWYPSYKLIPPREDISSAAHVKNLTKRKLNRLIKKWKLPIGTIIRISNRWVGSEYKIKIIK